MSAENDLFDVLHEISTLLETAVEELKELNRNISELQTTMELMHADVSSIDAHAGMIELNTG